MNYEFNFDETRTDELKSRLRKRMIRLFLPIVVLVFLFQYLMASKSMSTELVAVMLFGPLVFIFFSVRSALNNVVAQFATFRIVVKGSSLECYFKTKTVIDLRNAAATVKPSGEIVLNHLSANWFLKFFSSKSRIIIPPEMTEYETLKKMIVKMSTRI